MEANRETPKPSIFALGKDLLKLTRFSLLLTISLPFIFFGLYFVFAIYHLWMPAVISVMALSFSTYGSTSHDLVHMNLQLNRPVNEVLLTLVELTSLRSGHAYRLSHLHHHKRFPHSDDIEGAAAKMTFLGSLLEGVFFQFKLYRWALKNYKHSWERRIIILEGALVVLLMVGIIVSIQYTFIFVVYGTLVIMGSWIFPFITSYLVHTPEGEGELRQTRLFRGRFFSLLAFDHLYHLEHHMYPMVPHRNWPELARRLDPYFAENEIHPIKVNSLDHEANNYMQ